MAASPVHGNVGLSFTPTWAVPSVMSVFVLLSLLLHSFIQRLGRYLKKHRQKPLYESLAKIKEELMLLGCMSLFLSPLSSLFMAICINPSYYERQFTQCKRSSTARFAETRQTLSSHGRFAQMMSFAEDHMCGKGKEPFLSPEEIHNTHRFLFVMAVTHIFYSCLTVALALLKIYSWKKWEEEIPNRNDDNISESVTKGIPLERKIMFELYNTSKAWSAKRLLLWMACFARQFKQSVDRMDYFAVRSRFIAEHNLPYDYNFHNYIDRCAEEDFSRILGISPAFWGLAILFIFLEADGFNFYFWIAFIPMIVVLVIGANLQYMVATLAITKVGNGDAHSFQKSHTSFLTREHLLSLLHFILFQNSFELATLVGSWWWHLEDQSCMIKRQTYIRVVFGLAAQILCSYNTLPMYALTTQMGAGPKKTMISKKVLEALRNWHMSARKNLDKRKYSTSHCQGD